MVAAASRRSIHVERHRLNRRGIAPAALVLAPCQVLMYHTMLATDQEFAAINIKIQHTMGKLMGTPFAP